MDSVCGRKQAAKVEGNSCLSANAAGASHFFAGKMKDLIKSDSTKVVLKKKQME